MGGAYVMATLISMIGSAAFLLSSAKENVDIYSGPAFAAGLWGLWALTLMALACAVRAIQVGDVRRHSEFMALSYACLLTAPVLRFGWSIVGPTSSLNQWDANLALATSLVPQTVLLAALWRSFRRDSRAVQIPAGDEVVPTRLLVAVRPVVAVSVVAVLNYATLRAGDPRLAPPQVLSHWDLTNAAASCFMVYAAGAASAMLIAMTMISAVHRAGPNALRVPAVRSYLVAVGLGCTGLVAFVFEARGTMTGGIVAVYYWSAVAIFWIVTTGLLLRSLLVGDQNRSIEWAIHSAAMTMQAALLHGTYLILGITGYADPVNRFITAATLAFAGAVALGYVAVVLLGRPSPRRMFSTRRPVAFPPTGQVDVTDR